MVMVLASRGGYMIRDLVPGSDSKAAYPEVRVVLLASPKYI